MLFVIISGNGNARMEFEPFLVSSAPKPTKHLADVNVDVDGNPMWELGNANIVTLMVGQLWLEDH